MVNDLSNNLAEQDFYKAKLKAFLYRLSSVFNPSVSDLLPFEEAKNIIKPSSETYSGLTTVQIDKIVGSEGRYRDFNRYFLPKKEHLRQRWVSIDKTHYEDIILPPVRLYEMGGIYFVRDGNHRVSVARSLGQTDIDAEVVSLKSKIAISPDMNLEQLRKAVIDYEKMEFYEGIHYLNIVKQDDIQFSETGRYETIKEHIFVHKYYLNEHQAKEMELSDAIWSWHENVYVPILGAIEEERLLSSFPGRTSSDLYIYLVQHWDELKHSYSTGVGIGVAARDLKDKAKRRDVPIISRFIEVLRAAGQWLKKKSQNNL
jgi:hypothetical protein